jgi:hypothetical protein
MRHQLRLCPDQSGQLRPEERTTAPTTARAAARADPVAGDEAGTDGLRWLWGLVELRLGQAEPDSAA